MTDSKPRQSGNVLFLILIAVALFAALSYAVTQSSRSGGDGVSRDKARLTASEVIQIATNVEQAVNRMQIINRCTDSQFNFSTPIYTASATTNPVHGVNHNASAPPDKRCHVFDVAGGGVSPHVVEGAVIEGQVTGGWRTGSGGAIVARVIDIGSPEPDIVWAFPHISRDVCHEIHAKLSLPTPLQEDTVGTWVPYTGSYATFGILGNDWAVLSGKRSFCALDAANPNAAYFFHVLIAR